MAEHRRSDRDGGRCACRPARRADGGGIGDAGPLRPRASGGAAGDAIFLTETAYLADVVRPASAWPEKTGTVTNTDRIVQMGRRALDPPGEARQDLWIIQQVARHLGLDWNYAGP